MKIAYIGNNYLSSYRRAEGYIKNYPDSIHHFFKIREWKDEDLETRYNIPYQNIEYFEFNSDFIKNGNYDIILQMNDKFFHHKINLENVNVLNLIQKNILFDRAQIIIDTYFNGLNVCLPKQDNFDDTDIVFLKPIYSSGSYDVNDIGYRKYKFGEIKNNNDNNYQITEFINSTELALLFFVSNGNGEVYCVDAGEQEYIIDDEGKPMLIYGESNLQNNIKYDLAKKFCLKLIKSEKYDMIKSFYSVQFIVKDNKFYLIDFNSRTGPASLEIELSNQLSSKVFNYLDFMVGNCSFEECQKNISNNAGFIYFAVNKNTGKKITLKHIENRESYIIFKNDNKKSGLCNNLVDVYAYAK